MASFHLLDLSAENRLFADEVDGREIILHPPSEDKLSPNSSTKRSCAALPLKITVWMPGWSFKNRPMSFATGSR
ncbi:MAG TPA: hypothetical protein VLH13_03960, partial [Methanomassiliicoccales archaeon]|nr:hypothetical protein [Methanomassiliicoccales archaeon]